MDGDAERFTATPPLRAAVLRHSEGHRRRTADRRRDQRTRTTPPTCRSSRPRERCGSRPTSRGRRGPPGSCAARSRPIRCSTFRRWCGRRAVIEVRAGTPPHGADALRPGAVRRRARRRAGRVERGRGRRARRVRAGARRGRHPPAGPPAVRSRTPGCFRPPGSRKPCWRSRSPSRRRGGPRSAPRSLRCRATSRRAASRSPRPHGREASAPWSASWPRGAGRVIVSGRARRLAISRRQRGRRSRRFWTGTIAAVRGRRAAAAGGVGRSRRSPRRVEPVTVRADGSRDARARAAIPPVDASLVAADGSQQFVRLWPLAEPGVFEGTIERASRGPIRGEGLACRRSDGRVRRFSSPTACARPPEHDRDAMDLVAAATGGVVTDGSDLAPLERHLRSLGRRDVAGRSPSDALGLVGARVRGGALRRVGAAPPAEARGDRRVPDLPARRPADVAEHARELRARPRRCWRRSRRSATRRSRRCSARISKRSCGS